MLPMNAMHKSAPCRATLMISQHREHNMVLAHTTNEKVRSYLLNGTNTAHDCLDLESDGLRYRQVRRNIDWNCALYLRQHPHATKSFGMVSNFNAMGLKHNGYGHSLELAHTAFVHLKKCGVHPIALCQSTIGKHHLVVIGMHEDANWQNMQTWGADAVICDPWANKVYPVAQFTEMQLEKNAVRYPAGDYAQHDCQTACNTYQIRGGNSAQKFPP